MSETVNPLEALVELQKKLAALHGRWGASSRDRARRGAGGRLGTAPTCAALGLARATFYQQRRRPGEEPIVPRVRRVPRQALAPTEREAVLALLHHEPFADLPPAGVGAAARRRPRAALLDPDDVPGTGGQPRGMGAA